MSIRLRLTLWYTAILVVALAIFAGVIYTGIARLRLNDLDAAIGSRAREARAQITFGVGRTAQSLAVYAPSPADLNDFTTDGVAIQYVDPDGNEKSSSTNLGTPIWLPRDAIAAIKRNEGGYWMLRGAGGEELRAYILPLALGGRDPFGAVVTAKPTASLNDTLHKAAAFLAAGMLGAALALAFVVYWVAGTALRPLKRMARDAAGIQQAHDLSRRVDVPRTGDEVADLAQTFNGMLGRLETVFDAQRRFIADASHELRTPLTAIRGNTDLLRYHGNRMDIAERTEILDEVASEGERMSRLINDLLALARAQAGGDHAPPQPLRFSEAIEGAVRAARGLARGHEITYHGASETLWVLGDPDRLKQLALILLDNAVKYTPSDGQIRVWVWRDGATAALRVEDDGPGIPSDRLPHLFERFFRGGTPARGRDDGGAGLGLAIAREIAEQTNGVITVESIEGHGTSFTVRFPLLPDAALAPLPTPVAATI